MKLASILLGSLFIFQTAVSAQPAKQFLVLSDIHFNALADPALAPQLLAAEPSQWEQIFAADKHAPVVKYNDDSPWPLFAALISGVQTVQPKPKLVIVTGDILTHKFQEKFAAATHLTDPAAFRSFVRKTAEFVALELTKASGDAPVVYTLGNNDQECGDYALQPSGPFLNDTADIVRGLAKHLAVDDWSALGSDVVRNPLARHQRVIALNTNFWSTRYVNACGDKSNDPGADVLTWLEAQLQDARKHHDKVWLAYHIPPGIDGHSSSRAKSVVTMWKPVYADGFNKLLDEYRATIELNLAGHTHLDDIRLVKTEHTTTLVLINPGVSPNVGQNPAFRVMTVDSHGRIADILTYYLPNLQTLKWQLEYSTRTAYGLAHIDAASYQSLYSQIDKSKDLADKWKLHYGVSRPEGLNDNKTYLRSLYCATGHTNSDDYKACLTQ